MILVIDNYDSFTYNLVSMISQEHVDVKVIKNDSHSLEEIEALKPRAILLSPGPSNPGNAGICLDLVAKFYKHIPILGICLGHQCIGAAFNAEIKQASSIRHGYVDTIQHNTCGIFDQVDQNFMASRYHSLLIDESSLPPCLMVTARSKVDGYIMAIKHIDYPVVGLQFHPESYMTRQGQQLIKNFINQI